MRVILAGSRGITDYSLLVAAVKQSEFRITTVLCGQASGVDQLGLEWAIQNGVDYEMWPADWKQHGKRAGILRNIQMADHADALISVWDGVSRGSKHMFEEMLRRKKPTFVYNIHGTIPLW